MKKFLAMALCLMILPSLGACSGNENVGNYTNSSEQISSINEASSEESVVENSEPTGIEGLVDEDGSPAGKVYDGIDGPGFTTEFFDNYTCRATFDKTGELKDFDDWKFIDDGKIRKIYREDKSVFSDYFIYSNYLVDVDVDSSWGKLEGNSQEGYQNSNSNTGDRILKTDGTYCYKPKYGEYLGTYKLIDDRIIFIDAKDEWGDPFPIYLFIDNDNLLHYAYPEVK